MTDKDRTERKKTKNTRLFNSFHLQSSQKKTMDHPNLDEFLFDEFDEDQFLDCNLDEATINEFLAPPADKWKDIDATNFKTKVTIDESKNIQWSRAKEEIEFILDRMKTIIDVDHDATASEVILHILGPQSPISVLLQQELNLSVDEYASFMMTFCIQAAYKVSSTQLFAPESLLSHSITTMSESSYNAIWKELATKKSINNNLFVGAGRREKCLWEYLENILNNLCRDISISNRPGRIAIALDDDKIWAALRKLTDCFGLKFTMHNKANRKGFVAHTAISCGANMPLGIMMERQKDSTSDCFERLLNFLFERNGTCDLRNVEVASDRGYMVPNTVFGFIVANGGDFIGTTKRTAQCWPFTYDQKARDNEKRTIVDTKGPPTLFVKTVSKALKSVYAIAFRNGSESVVTAVSSVHRNHHWEGVALSQRELLDYEEDDTSLRRKCIQRVKSNSFNEDELEIEKELIGNLYDERIDPLTIRQGKNSFICV
jgi:hypothetical protein